MNAWTFASLFLACGTAVVWMAIGYAKYSDRNLEEHERCHALTVWQVPTNNGGKATHRHRCTLPREHEGPHHVEHPNVKKEDYWWPQDTHDTTETRKGKVGS